MSRKHASNGDFHNGIPDKHKGHKGDHSDDIRSSAERERADAAGKKPEATTTSASPRQVPKDQGD